MGGKVFAGSESIQEDLSKVLFDYFSKAAKKIVAEEQRLEGLLSARDADLRGLAVEAKRVRLIEAACWAADVIAVVAAFAVAQPLAVAAVVATAAGIHQLFKRRGIERRMRALEAEKKALLDEHAAIRRDYKVHRLGVAYVPVASQIPFEGHSITVDHTGTAPLRDFNLYMVKRQDEFKQVVQDLEGTLAAVPLVESSNTVSKIATDEHSRSVQSVQAYDFFGKLDQQMNSASALLGELDRRSVSLPVVLPGSPLAGFLDEHAMVRPPTGPSVEAFPTGGFDQQIEQFLSLNEMKRAMEDQTKDFEGFLRDLMSRLAWTVQAVAKVRMGSTERLTLESNKALFQALKASFNHYSPKLEADEIERIRQESFDFSDSAESYRPFTLKQSSRVRFDPTSGNWAADDGSRSSHPFGVLQIHEEVLAPIIQSLMQETRVERMRAYNDIKDQKLAYLREWRREVDDFYGRNRTEGNQLVTQMQASLTEFTAALNKYEAFERTRKGMEGSKSLEASVVEDAGADASSVAAYAAQSQRFVEAQQEFAEYMDRLQEEMERKSREFLHIEYFDASLRDGEAKRRSESLTRVAGLDIRRRQLLAVDAFFAEHADLPPSPDMDDSAREAVGIDLPKVAEERLAGLAGGAAAAQGGL